MTRALPLAALLVLAACPRLSVPTGGAPSAVQPLGSPCGNASECASDACVDGVCCNRACDSTESCVTDRALGTCTVRVLGDACASGKPCGRGLCTEGICCESECTGNCMTCRSSTHPGHCALADDNTDPQNHCNGACSACFGGLCLPALDRTDPKDLCGDGVCGESGRCGKVEGAACAATSECAAGSCSLGVCSVVQTRQVVSPALAEASSDVVFVNDLVRDAADDAVGLVRVRVPSGDGTESRRYLLTRPFADPPRLSGVDQRQCMVDGTRDSVPTATMTTVGTQAVVVLADLDLTCELDPEFPRGISAYWFAADLSLVRHELVWDAEAVDLAEQPAFNAEAVFDPAARRVTTLLHRGAPDGNDRPIALFDYAIDARAWSSERIVVPNAWRMGNALLDNGDLFLAYSQDRQRPSDQAEGLDVSILWMHGGQSQQFRLEPGCELVRPAIIRAKDGLVVSWLCIDSFTLEWAAFTPGAATPFGAVETHTVVTDTAFQVLLSQGAPGIVEAGRIPGGASGLWLVDPAAPSGLAGITAWSRPTSPVSVRWTRANGGLVVLFSLVVSSSPLGGASLWTARLAP